MLELQDITFTVSKDGAEHDLVHEASLQVPTGHFMAIVGPSGCGKTTLLKIVAGLYQETSGTIAWEGRNLSEEGDLAASEIGYVPQFSIAYEHLTVEESVTSAARLRVRARGAEIEAIADRALEQTGLASIGDRVVSVLSGGQRRRLALALELVSDPLLLLCDEVTSGLDPESESEIVRLMHQLAARSGRIVVNVTHSLGHLELYDSVLVMFEGRVVYHGPPGKMPHYFSADNAEEVYPCLAKRSAERWHASWTKHGDAYSSLLSVAEPPGDGPAPAPGPATDSDGDSDSDSDADPEDGDGDGTGVHEPADLPGGVTQFAVLLGRRLKLFFRDRTQLALHLALLFGFPLLVIIFALDGIEPMPQRADFSEVRTAADYAQQTETIGKQVALGGLVSGLVMFQVVLLTLMGSNNSAREVAGERLIFEKEKFAGLRPGAYLASKVVFLGLLVVAQSAWMAVFVNHFTHLPGDFAQQLTLLVAVNAAMTAVCLGISAVVRSAEQSSLLSIYLVGFQLPLSGAVLALPAALESVTRPFIAAYWAWSGSLQSMKSSDYFVGIKEAAATPIDTTPEAALFVLGCHVLCGLAAAYVGTRLNRWH